MLSVAFLVNRGFCFMKRLTLSRRDIFVSNIFSFFLFYRLGNMTSFNLVTRHFRPLDSDHACFNREVKERERGVELRKYLSKRI